MEKQHIVHEKQVRSIVAMFVLGWRSSRRFKGTWHSTQTSTEGWLAGEGLLVSRVSVRNSTYGTKTFESFT